MWHQIPGGPMAHQHIQLQNRPLKTKAPIQIVENWEHYIVLSGKHYTKTLDDSTPGML